MNTDEILLDILSKRVDTTGLTDDSSLTDLGLDSLDLVEIMLEIESQLKIEFTNDEILALHTIGDVRNLINSKMS